MADLSRWNPFRFDRNNGRAQQQPQRGNGNTNVPARQGQTWNDPFHQMRNQMDQMMRSFFNDDWFTQGLRGGFDTPQWFGDFTPQVFSPSVDVVNEKKHLVVNAELPGLEKKDINITLDEGVLTISGEKKQEKTQDEEGCYRTERYFGSFRRQIPLPNDVDVDHAEAHFDKGVLNIRLPKVESREKKSRQIELK